MRKVQVALESLGHHELVFTTTSFYRPINLSIHINVPKGRKICLHHYVVIQEHHLVQTWKQLREMNSDMIHH
uniref:Uncharacterized protein n=1 Tax=Rhizophora mucronata TaxID=61149 RepID=A0A2P2QBL7_RHIMU